MELNGAAIRAASTGFHAVFLEGFDAATPNWPGWMMEVPSSGSRETYHFGQMLGSMREWLGDRHIEALEREPYTIANQTWEQTVGVPREAFEDDELGVYKLQLRGMGIAVRLHPDQLRVGLIENGFADACYDGEAFFSVDHPLKDGSTQSNLVTGALSATTYESARLKLRTMKTWGGLPAGVLKMGGRLTLECGPANEVAAREILKKEYIDGGDTNPNYESADLEINDLIEGNHWTLGVKGGAFAPFILQMRRRAKLVEKTELTDDEVFHKNRFLWGVDGRWSAGYGLYHFLVGSLGE